tara:strand:- start:343 stop:561 length:219 start_codon:yes stop_codon:yes gene_type:complete
MKSKVKRYRVFAITELKREINVWAETVEEARHKARILEESPKQKLVEMGYVLGEVDIIEAVEDLPFGVNIKS